METLNKQIIIDNKFKPHINQTYLEYFSRAMKFAQTNYSIAIEKLQRINFHNLSPALFFEEYVWLIFNLNESNTYLYAGYPEITQQLLPFYKSFVNFDYFPNEKEIDQSLGLTHFSEGKKKAITQCAWITSRGIKLFEWKYYRNNFLNTSDKLRVFPLLNTEMSLLLAKNIGVDVLDNRLQLLAEHFGFSNIRLMCATIRRNVSIQLKIIELILWYSVAHFDPYLLKP